MQPDSFTPSYIIVANLRNRYKHRFAKMTPQKLNGVPQKGNGTPQKLNRVPQKDKMTDQRINEVHQAHNKLPLTCNGLFQQRNVASQRYFKLFPPFVVFFTNKKAIKIPI